MCITQTKRPTEETPYEIPPKPVDFRIQWSQTAHLQSGISRSSRYQLPHGLIEAILFHLRHRKDSLKSCSLVSRNWTHYCRQHLFRQVTLDWTRKDSPRGNSESFLALLDDSPIGHFIQILDFVCLNNFLVNGRGCGAHVGVLVAMRLSTSSPRP